MADKEERIFVFTTKKYTIKETNKDGVIVNGFIEPRDKAKMYTRQDAIYKMAAAMYYENYDRKELPVAFTEQSKETQRYWEKIAKAALNALLGGGKK